MLFFLFLSPVFADGFLLKIRDQQDLLSDPAEIAIAWSTGEQTQIIVKDDGNHPDAAAGDHVWSGPVLSSFGEEVLVTIKVENKAEPYTVQSVVKNHGDGPLLALVLNKKGLLEAVEPGRKTDNTTAPRSDSATIDNKTWDGKVSGFLAAIMSIMGFFMGLVVGFWLKKN